MKRFSDYLKELLSKKAIKKAELARKLGLKRQSYITNVTSGLHTPTLNRVEQIAKILKCDDKERSQLIDLAEKERTPDEAKVRGNIGYTMGTVSKIGDMLHVGFVLDVNKMRVNRELLSSLVFKVSGGFLEPLVKNGQKVILGYNVSLKVGDWAIFEIEINEGNYTKLIVDFKKANHQLTYLSVRSGHDHIIGRLISRENGVLTIGGHKNETSTINISEKDIFLKARIMGILF